MGTSLMWKSGNAVWNEGMVAPVHDPFRDLGVRGPSSTHQEFENPFRDGIYGMRRIKGSIMDKRTISLRDGIFKVFLS